MKKRIAVFTILSLITVFSVSYSVARVRKAESTAIISANSQIKKLQEPDKLALMAFLSSAGSQWSGVPDAFRCSFAESAVCAGVVGKEVKQIGLSGTQRNDLILATKSLWVNDGFLMLTSIDCDLKEKSACQVNGFVRKPLSAIGPLIYFVN